jgi:hypothetical protein
MGVVYVSTRVCSGFVPPIASAKVGAKMARALMKKNSPDYFKSSDGISAKREPISKTMLVRSGHPRKRPLSSVLSKLGAKMAR